MTPAFRVRDAYVALCGAATPLLDGFSTASAAFLILLIPDLSALETALMTSLYLAGSLAGSLLIAPLADRYGRRTLFLGAAFGVAAATAAALALPEVGVILAMRLLTGFLLGGDYPVAQAVVVEGVRREVRARSLTVLMLAWNVGALLAVAAALPVRSGVASWHLFWTLQLGTAAVCAFLRLRIPESEDWRAGRREGRTAPGGAGLERDQKNALFCAIFWLCQTVPATVMMFYSVNFHETGNRG